MFATDKADRGAGGGPMNTMIDANLVLGIKIGIAIGSAIGFFVGLVMVWFNRR
jgi:hypothetical protein